MAIQVHLKENMDRQQTYKTNTFQLSWKLKKCPKTFHSTSIQNALTQYRVPGQKLSITKLKNSLKNKCMKIPQMADKNLQFVIAINKSFCLHFLRHPRHPGNIPFLTDVF